MAAELITTGIQLPVVVNLQQPVFLRLEDVEQIITGILYNVPANLIRQYQLVPHHQPVAVVTIFGTRSIVFAGQIQVVMNLSVVAGRIIFGIQ